MSVHCNYPNSIATSPTFAHLHEKAAHFVRATPENSGTLRAQSGVKASCFVVPSVIFEELGLRYYGPIDGTISHCSSEHLSF
jgi:1-deoxy-D-xylulose-5-phosphate synthase